MALSTAMHGVCSCILCMHIVQIRTIESHDDDDFKKLRKKLEIVLLESHQRLAQMHSPVHRVTDILQGVRANDTKAVPRT